jgi:hypothetical protein
LSSSAAWTIVDSRIGSRYQWLGAVSAVFMDVHTIPIFSDHWIVRHIYMHRWLDIVLGNGRIDVPVLIGITTVPVFVRLMCRTVCNVGPNTQSTIYHTHLESTYEML